MTPRTSSRSWPSRRLLTAPAILTACVALAVAGCGGGDDAEEAADTGGDEASALVQEAEQAIEEAKQPLTFEPPGPPIDAAEVQGESVLVVSVDQRVPTLAAAVAGIEEAAGLVGLDVEVFDAEANPSRMQQGVQQAIDQDKSALILVGIPIELVRDRLGATEIPAVEVLNNEPDPDAPGQGAGENVYATSAPSYETAGELLAFTAIADTEGAANVVIFKSTSGADPSVPTAAGIERVLERCEGCEFSSNDTPLQDWSTELAPLAQSEIQGNPNVNFLLPVFDGMGLFVASGVRQADAGDRVKVASFNGVPAALELVQDGDVMVADPGQGSTWNGWHALDQAMRGILGTEPADPEVPLRYFDQENLEGVEVNDEGELYGTEYRDGYMELWGID